MWEFIQANFTWIALGVFFLLMMRMHGGGMGCGGGHGDHGGKQEPAPPAGTTPRTVSDRQPGEREPVGSGSAGHGGHHQ